MASDGRQDIAIVTGGGSGIGAALVRQLSRGGMRVAVFSEKDVAATDSAICDEIIAAGGEAVSFQVDVADSERVKVAVAQVIERFGRIDRLVNNAGLFAYAPFDQTTNDQLRTLMDVNYIGCWNMIQAVLPHMRHQKRGSIVNVASMAAIFPAGATAAYAASKGAVVAMTRALVPELAKSGIRINTVLPGAVRTPMTAAFHRPSTPESEAILARRLARSPSPDGRSHLEPEDVAEVIAFLLSDAARGVHGAILPVADGLGAAMEPFL